MSTPDPLRRILARNTAWNYAGFAINLATNLVVFPFVVVRIGDAAAGVWLLFAAVTGYMGLLELGIVPSLTQTIAAARARGEQDSVSRAASTSQAVLIGLGGCALLALVPSISWIIHALRIPEPLQHEAWWAFLITIVGFALRMPLATYQGILLGCQRQDRCNQLWIVVGLAKFAGAAVVLSLGYGLVGLVAVEMLVHLLAGILQVTWVFRELPGLRLSHRLVNVDDVRHLLSFGSAILAVSICSLIIEQTDRLVVAAFLPIAEVTYYAAAWKIYMLAFALTTTIVQAMSPAAAELHGRGDYAALTALFLRTTKYALIVAWPMVMGLFFAGGFLLRIWMGEPFVSSLAVVQALLVGFIVTAHNHAGYSALMGVRRVAPVVWRYFLPQAVLNVVLSIVLVQRMGIVGVAIGTTLPAILLEAVFLDFVLKEMRVSWRQFAAKVAAPIGLAALLAFAPLALMYSQVDQRSPLLALGAAICAVADIALVWRWLDADEREDLLAYVPRALRRRVRGLLVAPPVARAGETS